MEQTASFMNDIQIMRAIEEGHMAISPYNEKNLTPVGYNFSFSVFIVSLKTKEFVKIYHEDEEWFFYLKPFETVLVLTREAIWVSKFIGGTFHSKVSLVTKGLGHVSTTLDPGWSGQLLVPLNNPTKKKIKVVVARDKNNEKIYETFITLVLFRSQEAALNLKTDNRSSRIELLEEILSNKKKNKAAEFVKKFVVNIKYSVKEMESYDDLNDPANRKEKINKFKRRHEDLIMEMDKDFEKINKLGEQTYKDGKIKFGIILTLTTVLLLLILLSGIFISEGEYLYIISGILAIIVPLIIEILKFVKEQLY